jgi:GntR family transcriptional regulator
MTASVQRARLAGPDPLAVDRVWPPASLAAPLLDADFSRTALYEEYARRCRVHLTGGQERVHAGIPTPAERGLLGIAHAPAVAAPAIERLGCSHGHPVEWRHTLLRGDRFSLTADFPSRTGYRADTAPERKVAR